MVQSNPKSRICSSIRAYRKHIVIWFMILFFAASTSTCKSRGSRSTGSRAKATVGAGSDGVTSFLFRHPDPTQESHICALKCDFEKVTQVIDGANLQGRTEKISDINLKDAGCFKFAKCIDQNEIKSTFEHANQTCKQSIEAIQSPKVQSITSDSTCNTAITEILDYIDISGKKLDVYDKDKPGYTTVIETYMKSDLTTLRDLLADVGNLPKPKTDSPSSQAELEKLSRDKEELQTSTAQKEEKIYKLKTLVNAFNAIKIEVRQKPPTAPPTIMLTAGAYSRSPTAQCQYILRPYPEVRVVRMFSVCERNTFLDFNCSTPQTCIGVFEGDRQTIQITSPTSYIGIGTGEYGQAVQVLYEKRGELPYGY